MLAAKIMYKMVRAIRSRPVSSDALACMICGMFE